MAVNEFGRTSMFPGSFRNSVNAASGTSGADISPESTRSVLCILCIPLSMQTVCYCVEIFLIVA